MGTLLVTNVVRNTLICKARFVLFRLLAFSSYLNTKNTDIFYENSSQVRCKKSNSDFPVFCVSGLIDPHCEMMKHSSCVAGGSEHRVNQTNDSQYPTLIPNCVF